MMFSRSFLLAWVLLALDVQTAAAQVGRLGRLSPEQRAALAPGLQVAYQSVAGGQQDEAAARLAALYVAEDAPPTPFLAAGPFRARFRGYLKTRLRGDHRIHLAGRGEVQVWFNDQLAMSARGDDFSQTTPPTISLAKGYNKLRIDYSSAPEGAAQLRVYWSGDDFPQEPLPPASLFSDGSRTEYQRARRLRRGRQLAADLHCFQCHQSAIVATGTAETCLPELERDAPNLSDAGSRLTSSWITAWLLAPARLRNEATMPRLLHGIEAGLAERQAIDLAAYLKSLRQRPSDPADAATAAAADPRQGKLGETLFEERGCIACHRFTAPGEQDEFQRLSLHFVGAKYAPPALAAFLRDTRHDYRWSRMPRFRLEPQEAEALARHVRDQSQGKPPDPSGEGDPLEGRRLFQASGCAACHAVQQQVAHQQAPAQQATQLDLFQANLEGGCLKTPTGVGRPDFGLSATDRQALVDFFQTDGSSLNRRSPAEFAERQIGNLRCSACHSRDDSDAQLPYVLIEDSNLGRTPDAIPHLTWAGEKLLTRWTERLFAGRLGYRTRDHFKIRMPEFPVRASLLASGLSQQHGFAPDELNRPAANAQLAKLGKAIAAMGTGLACNRCHAIGKQKPSAPFEARSTDFVRTKQRLRYDFYLRWMLDPQRVDRGTRMLKFSPDGRKTGLATYFEGDAQQQFIALWHYLMEVEEGE